VSQIIEPVLRLINQFSKLPGIGYKTAQRLAFHVINLSDDEVEEFAKDLFYAKKKAVFCPVCGNLMQKGEHACVICEDAARDAALVCVVSDIKDVLAIEKTREYKGIYHVLHGVISPMDGIGPDDINIAGGFSFCHNIVSFKFLLYPYQTFSERSHLSELALLVFLLQC